MPLLNYMMMKNCEPSFENSQTLVESKYPFEDGQKAFKEIFASVGVYSSK
jgi:hypothetical protein